MNYAIAYWPESPEALYGVGAKQDACLRRVTVHAPQRIDMWHPALPEVRVSRAATPAPRIYTLQPLESRNPNWPWNPVEPDEDVRLKTPFWHPALPLTRIMYWPTGGEVIIRRKGERTWFGAIVFSLLALAAPAFAAEGPPCKVNVQTCNVAQCAMLPGIGQVKAGEIVKARPKTEAELDAVKGIGPATLEDIRPFVAYTGETTCTSKQTAPKGEKE